MAKMSKTLSRRKTVLQITRSLTTFCKVAFLGYPRALEGQICPEIDEPCVKEQLYRFPKFDDVNGTVSKAKKRLRPIDITIPEEYLLARCISVEGASQAELRDAAALELQHRTPLNSDDITWGLSRAQNGQAVQWIARLEDVRLLSEYLKHQGFALRVLKLRSPNENVTIFEAGVTWGKYWRRVNAALAFIAALLLCIIWLWPAYLAHQQLNELAMQKQVLQTQAVLLKNQLNETIEKNIRRKAFSDAQTRAPNISSLLAALTEELDDTIWLKSLTLTGSRVTLEGETKGSASKAVIALSKHEAFSRVVMNGPIQRISPNLERFRISLDWTMAP